MMDLEQFPTSPSAKRMLSYVTKEWYEKSYVGKWLYQVMGMELDEIRTVIEELPYQIFPETATWGLQYFEILYGLPVNPAGKTLDERRNEILKKRNLRAPLNPDRLAEYVFLVTGVRVHIIENVRPYTFKVVFEDTDFAYSLKKLFDEIRSMKPSHLSFLYGIQFKIQNREVMELNKIRIHLWIPWLGKGAYLDGSFLLDGTILLGYQYNFNPMKVKIRSYIFTRAKNSTNLRVRMELGGKGKIEAGATLYQYWRLNGAHKLNGEKQIGPDIRKEEL